jgi:hypothetical protein
MSTVMLICAAITAVAAITSIRYLPGRATPVTAATRDHASPAGTRR